MTRTLLLARHAEYDPKADSNLTASLTPHGHEQAAHIARTLAKLLASQPPPALLSSPATRTRQTAAPLAEILGVTPALVNWLIGGDNTVLEAIYAPQWEDSPTIVAFGHEPCLAALLDQVHPKERVVTPLASVFSFSLSFDHIAGGTRIL